MRGIGYHLSVHAARVVSVNISPGGIPKRAVESGRLGASGLRGDGHDHEKHNTPLQAVSVLDLEDIEELAREGFDVRPGATGENLTVAGLEVDGLAAGDRLRFAGGAVIELTRRRRPCFVLDAIDPRLKERIDGRCGFYARTIEEGTIRPGEAIEVIAAAPDGAARAMAPERWLHTGAVLAGGRSSRMGTPKHALPLGGRTMIDRVTGALARVCARVVVVGGPPGAAPALPRVQDRRAEQGPLSGIESLLASGIDEAYLVCPCDMPLVDEELLIALTRGAGPVAVLQLAGERVPRPLPIRIDRAVLPQVRALLDSERRAVRGLLALAEVIEAPAAWAERLADVNTPGEYEEIRRRGA
jgi:molybdopterin-guanine dinucleotide biosynthesis protein A